MLKGRVILFGVFGLAVLVVLLILINPVAQKDTDIRIGAVFPLSGRFAAMGTPLKYATDIAVTEVNAEGLSGKRRIRILYEDSKGVPKDGATAAQKLITVDKTPIITSFLTGVCEAIKPISESSGVLFLAQTVAPRIHLGSKLTVRFHYSFTEEGRIISEFIVNQKIKKIGIISSNDPSTTYQVDSVILPIVLKNGIIVEKENFSIGNKDFSAIVQKMKSSNADLVYLAGYGNDMPAILTELHKSKMTAQNMIVCGNIGFIELPAGTPAELYEGVVFTTPPFIMSAEDSLLTKFRKKYQELSGEEQVGYAAYYAYDMIKILAEVLKRSSSVDPTALRANLAGEFRGICGIYTVTPDGDVTPPVTLGRYVNGAIVPVAQSQREK